MLRIAICCGEGFSSGFLSRHLTETTILEQLQNEVSFVFIPFFQLYDRQDEVDIAMLMPHIEPMAKNDDREYRIPLYIIPFKVVIKPKARDFMDDAEDIIALANGKGGLFHFEGEERTAQVSRLISHRRWLAENE